MGTYICRPAEEKDYRAVCNLFKRVTADLIAKGVYQWDEIYPNDENAAKDIKNREMHVLEAKGEIAAVFVLNREAPLYERGSWLNKDGAWIALHRFCVDPDLQGQGVGKAAFAQAESIAKSLGSVSLRLDAYTLNTASNRLYQGQGCRKCGEADYRKGRFNLYEKLL
ncbi:MAG: GNAT family N-acetyltransferase [Oscillospiraceae bacterium]|nr:GNAT family N-acetyltransferase [Oscillospiraceae bacterium]